MRKNLISMFSALVLIFGLTNISFAQRNLSCANGNCGGQTQQYYQPPSARPYNTYGLQSNYQYYPSSGWGRQNGYWRNTNTYAGGYPQGASYGSYNYNGNVVNNYAASVNVGAAGYNGFNYGYGGVSPYAFGGYSAFGGYGGYYPAYYNNFSAHHYYGNFGHAGYGNFNSGFSGHAGHMGHR